MTSTTDNAALGMSHIGTDVLELRKNRAKRGECPSCGMKLFKIAGNQMLANTDKKKQTPFLSKNGKTVSGRCLMCHPLEPEEKDDQSGIPKVLFIDEDEDSAISEVTLDRRLIQSDADNFVPRLQSSLAPDDYSKGITGISTTSATKSSRPSKSSQWDDNDYESLTDSENDDEGPRRKSPQHKSVRSMNNSSHHNVISLSSSARNRWGESEAGDADLSTGPRPQPPKRVASGDGEKNLSLHQSLPSRITTTTACNTTEESPHHRPASPRLRSSSPNQRSSGQNPNNRIPRIIIPNSPTKKSNFTPPWNPRSQNETVNARKPGESVGKASDDNRTEASQGREHMVLKNEIIFNSGNSGEEAEERGYVDERKQPMANGRKMSHQDASRNKEITLFGLNYSGLQTIPHLDESRANVAVQRSSVHDSRKSGESNNHDHTKASEDIHVDLTSFVHRSSRRISSPVKEATPRTLKRQKALNMLVQMEQIFPPEHVTSVKPPKKVQRAISMETEQVPSANGTKHHLSQSYPGRTGSNIIDETTHKELKSRDLKNLLLLISDQEETQERRIIILRFVTDLMWAQESHKFRAQFSEESGMEILTTILWTEMVHPNVQTAVLKLLFALASGPCDHLGDHISPMAFDGADVIIDALLITMEQHTCIEELQLLGCQVLCCLSSELSSTAGINDGTRSGACLAILTAIEAHRDAVALQEWGIRTLYNQCVHSKHSETNKRTILSSTLEHPLCSDGSGRAVSGGDVLLRVLKSSTKSQSHGLLLEWTCKLYKALSTSRVIAEMLSPCSDMLRIFLNLVHRNNVDVGEEAAEDDSLELIESALCTISSLLIIDHNKSYVDTSDVFLLMLDTMCNKKKNPDIVLICCVVLSKLAAEPSLRKEALPGMSAVRRIIDAMLDFPNSKLLQDAGIRTLACLSLGSVKMKEQLCDRVALGELLGLCDKNGDTSDSSLIQENMCTLIASLYSIERLQEKALQCDTLDMLRKTMERRKRNVKMQEVAVVALMNLSTGVNVDFLVQGNTVELIVSAMEHNTTSVVIQKNACCALWNIGVKTRIGRNRLLEAHALKFIVSALQSHLDDHDVVEMACGSLWGLCDNNENFKQQLLHVDGALESIAWTLVMHPNSPALQEKACGVLATVSTCVCEENVSAAASCITNIVDAIRRNPKSIPVLQSGARFLGQVVLYIPRHSDEACEVVSIFITAMKENGNSYGFQQDACNLLKTMAEKSPTAKERILKMDGMTVLMDLLDKSRSNENVENAALLAFKELALTSKTE
jgi:hypothetical protein